MADNSEQEEQDEPVLRFSPLAVVLAEAFSTLFLLLQLL
jgi:hypothetical protein